MIDKKFFLMIFISLFIVNFVSAMGPQISVTLLNQDPDPVNQGDIVQVRFKIENNGAETLEEIAIQFLPSYPFSLYSGDFIKSIGKLRASQTGTDSVIVDFKLKVDEKAIEGDAEIEIQILKNGSPWIIYNKDQFTIDVDEQDIPDIRVYLKENNILEKDSKGKITFELANVDENDVKFLQLTLVQTDDYKLLSPSNYIYIGDIDSDDTETQEFEIYVNELGDNFVSIPVILEYQDINEEKYVKKIDLGFEVYDSKELKKYKLKETKKGPRIFAVAILLIILYTLYRKKRKKKHV